MSIKTATFAGGCFYNLQAPFKHVPGIHRIDTGYTGGITRNPTHQEVVSRNTGHAEAIQITFEDSHITFKELLRIFFLTHDPTTLNRQGPLRGTQFRSEIFYHDEKQMQEAIAARLYIQNRISRPACPIVTDISPATAFYPAIESHTHTSELAAI
ncbi:peptide-methionine (S)-S-oxide reductase MsrA [Poriferisphaera sp. WC338]|uniref:peptide-methionine (S)-S-oxide reductase MsrA n=1 Tax=Poriferisphaera sp. WC338 TaxID=3425129 RepID=UPI003D81390A